MLSGLRTTSRNRFASIMNQLRYKTMPSLGTFLRFVAALILLSCQASTIVMSCSTNDHQYGTHFYRIRTNVMYSATSMSFRSCVKACQARTSCRVMAYNEKHRYCELGPNRDDVIYDENFRTLVKNIYPPWISTDDACSIYTCAEMEICVHLTRGGYTCVRDETMFTSDNRFVREITQGINVTDSASTYNECVNLCLSVDCPAFFFGNNECYIRGSRESVNMRSEPGMVYYERTGPLGNIAIRGFTKYPKIIDGNRTSTRFYSNGSSPDCFPGATEYEDLVVIYLLRYFYVTEVAILTREDGPYDHANFSGNIEIYVPPILCSYFNEPGGYGKMISRKCQEPILGLEIYITKYVIPLSVCEVEVYGFI